MWVIAICSQLRARIPSSLSVTAVSVAIIVGLVLGELRFYFLDSADPDYKFTVDTDFNE